MQRFFLVVYLVQVTSVDQVVERIKKVKYRAKEEVVKSSEFSFAGWGLASEWS